MQPILSSLSLTANERGTKAFVAAFSNTPDGMSLSASGTVTGASSQAPDKLTMMAALLFSEGIQIRHHLFHNHDHPK